MCKWRKRQGMGKGASKELERKGRELRKEQGREQEEGKVKH